MALIRCDECRKKVSEQADRCPKCGFDLLSNRLLKMQIQQDKVYEWSTLTSAQKRTRRIKSLLTWPFRKPIKFIFFAVLLHTLSLNIVQSASSDDKSVASSPAFKQHRTAITSSVSCSEENLTPGGDGWGSLYGCIGGDASTVKVFINDSPDASNIKNIKFMWNDYTNDVGYGIHADKNTAQKWLSDLSEEYFPNQLAKVSNAFFTNKNTVVNGDSYTISFRYHHGPSADERLLIISPKMTKSLGN